MAELIDQGDGRLTLAGRLTSDSVLELEPQGRALLAKSGTSHEIDLAEVTFSSSAGVALLLAWLRAAQVASAEVVFKNLPASMLGLLRVSELEHVLPVAEPGSSTAAV